MEDEVTDLIPEVDVSVEGIKELIEKNVDKGVIAQRLGLDVEVVQKITARSTAMVRANACPVTQTSAPREILISQLGVALDAVDLAINAYDEKPTGGNAQGLSMLINTVQSLIKDVQAHIPIEENIRRIDVDCLQPLITDLIKSMTAEMGKARNDILVHVDPSKQPIIIEAIKQGLQGFGAASKACYERSIENLRNIVSGETGKKK